ncbi:MAG: DUF3618 domain-containing protein [Sphingosinicella sp.]|nr:DUF3618 domain-containing protein [Sphingosinicella sp.]
MDKSKQDPGLARLQQAKLDAERAKGRLSSTMGALQYRLRPGNLANDAWSGVKEKSGAMADDALQAVKDRPVATSGILAALIVFLARDPIRAVVSGLLRDENDQDLIKADLSKKDDNYDLATPVVAKSVHEGANA